jgi:aminomethyltransferase
VLRLEAGLPLHGSDLDAATNPYQAGLDRFVDPDREGYVAGEALRALRDRGADRHLVGFNVLGRGIPRHGHPITVDGQTVGSVTSGSFSPTLDTSIGMGYVPTGRETVGSRLQIDIRGRPVDAAVTALPFYSREK